MFAPQGVQNQFGAGRVSQAGLSHFSLLKNRISTNNRSPFSENRFKSQSSIKVNNDNLGLNKSGKGTTGSNISGTVAKGVINKHKSSMSNSGEGGRNNMVKAAVKTNLQQKKLQGSGSSGTSSQSHVDGDLDLDNLEAELKKLEIDEQKKRFEKLEQDKMSAKVSPQDLKKKRSSLLHLSDINKEDDLDNVTDDGKGHKLLNLDTNSGVPRQTLIENKMETQREQDTKAMD